MRILIIGASGLIGSVLSARLLAEGHEIVGVARHPPRSLTAVIEVLATPIIRSRWLALSVSVDQRRHSAANWRISWGVTMAASTCVPC
jgi:nucleoside-diphosphate-sugar epimerase